MSACAGKRRYRTRRAAERVLLAAKIRRGLRDQSWRRECRAYRCPTCGFHHLTSREAAPQTDTRGTP